MLQTIIPKLESSLNEKDTENIWRETVSGFFPTGIITSPFNTDGYLETSDGKISILFEFKFQENLKSKLSQVNILSQTLYYLKKFEVNGRKLPKVILIADKNECFVIHTNPLVKYLSYDLNWNVAASTAFKTNTDLIQDMLGDMDINPFVFDIVEGFNFRAIENKIVDLSERVVRLIKVTEHNITNVYEYFCNNVLGKNALSVNETANLFVNLIINPGENYLHPKRKNILVTKSFGDVYVITDKYLSFFSHFDGEQYSIREKEALTAIVDRIVEDETRRRKGEFFTPTIWVDEAHKMISEVFGENWKEEYVVWDPASGTLNLTRDYRFKELYCSTIEDSDLKTADQMKYNPESVKFQYDFLNDSWDKLPQKLKDMISDGKEIIILMNPPYASSGTMNENLVKTGITETSIAIEMKNNELGKVSQEMYTQFIYKCMKMGCHICLFSKPMFITSPSFKNLRRRLFSDYDFQKGFMLDASEFADVKSWGLTFSILTNRKFFDGVKNRKTFPFELLSNKNFTIQKIGDRNLYNVDDIETGQEWVKKSTKNIRTYDLPQLKSALEVKQSGYGRNVHNSLGYMYSDSNNVYKNSQGVCIVSSVFSHGHGVPVTRSNILNVTSFFSARKLIDFTWQGQYDEYLAPDETHQFWDQFKYDSLVHSLFNNHSQQSSLRQINYKDKLWDIKNEFFWMSKDEMMSLAESKYFDDVYRDAKSSDERYVYKLLFKDGIYEKLSPDAKEVLDMASALVVKTFDMRKVLNEEKPEFHLNTWDAGWYQIKLVLKLFFQDDLREFTKKYKEFEDRMRPLVYELGFLRK
jgi:hypothetical protein